MLNIENIPNELQELAQWVCWQARPKDNGKLDKVPISPKTGRNASHSNPKTWGTFQQALARYQGDKLAGIGFVFSKDDPYTGVDLDTCRDLKTGNIEPWALQIIQDLTTYTEISPSGTGLHVIAKATLPGGGRKNEQLEVYSSQRFFTITGEHLGETPTDVFESQEAVTKLYNTHFKKEAISKPTSQTPPQIVDLDDAELLARAFGSKNGSTFELLFNGQWQAAGYSSHSEADQALSNNLAFWTGNDAARIDSLFRRSALIRKKWDEKHYGDGRTYGQATIEKAIASTRNFYDPNQRHVKSDPQTEKQPKPLSKAVLETEDFLRLEIPERQALLAPWLKNESITLLSGWRGVGKSWFAMSIVNAVTTGQPFGPWKVETTCPCLFLDGEMVTSDTQARLRQLLPESERKAPLYIYNDCHANALGLKRANLLNENWQKEMKDLLLEKGIKLWIIDNIASLTPGSDENVKHEWDGANQFLLELRFSGISTILIHHVGKQGDQRGTSGREDNIDISLNLIRPANYVVEDGARFVVKFLKARIPHEDLSAIADTEFKWQPGINDCMTWTWKSVKKQHKIEVLKLLDEGLSQKNISEYLGIDKGYVSRIAKQAKKDVLISDKGKLTQTGFVYVNDPSN